MGHQTWSWRPGGAAGSASVGSTAAEPGSSGTPVGAAGSSRATLLLSPGPRLRTEGGGKSRSVRSPPDRRGRRGRGLGVAPEGRRAASRAGEAPALHQHDHRTRRHVGVVGGQHPDRAGRRAEERRADQQAGEPAGQQAHGRRRHDDAAATSVTPMTSMAVRTAMASRAMSRASTRPTRTPEAAATSGSKEQATSCGTRDHDRRDDDGVRRPTTRTSRGPPRGSCRTGRRRRRRARRAEHCSSASPRANDAVVITPMARRRRCAAGG